jgi:hypothetical protein
MSIRLRLFIIFLGALVVAAVWTFPLWQSITIREETITTFPGLDVTQQAVFDTFSPEQRESYNDLLETNPALASVLAQAATSGDVVVPEADQALPDLADPNVVGIGTFTTIDPILGAEGTATILQAADNRRYIRLENFRVTNAPDLRLILTRRSEPRTVEDVGNDYVDLGLLRGNVGDQTIPMPREVDLLTYRAVVIYSVTFSTVFSSAEITLR